MSTEDVLNHHLQSFGAGDIEETMQDYTDDSVLMTADGKLTGKVAIREAFESFYSDLFKPSTYEFTMDRVDIEGDVAFIVWHSSHDAAQVPLGTDTFLIRKGKISVQTFAAKIEAD